jgi:hypothetical protein
MAGAERLGGGEHLSGRPPVWQADGVERRCDETPGDRPESATLDDLDIDKGAFESMEWS